MVFRKLTPQPTFLQYVKWHMTPPFHCVNISHPSLFFLPYLHLYEFPIADVTDCLRTTYNYSFIVLVFRSPNQVSLVQTEGVDMAALLLETPGKKSPPCVFLPLRTSCMHQLMAPSLYLGSQQYGTFKSLSLTSSSSLPFKRTLFITLELPR